jgi:hypothetical protein
VLYLLQQNPIIVDVGPQPNATGDISIDFVVGMFAMAGVFLLAAAIGSLIVAGIVFAVKRRQAARGTDGATSHTQLKI